MLRVPTFVAPSAISGMGLFAGSDIEAGTVIWQFDDRVDWRIAPDEFAGFPEPYRSRMRHYVYLDGDGHYVLCGDNAKFMNHAEHPNCEDSDGEFTITRRAIARGEELTCDYTEFDVESRTNGLDFGGST